MTNSKKEELKKEFWDEYDRVKDYDSRFRGEELFDHFVSVIDQLIQEKVEKIEKKLEMATKRKNEIENDPFHPARCQYLGQEDAFKFAITILKE